MVAIQTARQAHCVYFPEEDHLSETDLFVIQAILHQISSDVIYEHCIKDSTTIDMQFRYFNLLDRLRATEVKIRHDDNNYYSDHVNYDAVIHGLAFSPDSWTRHIHKSHNTEPAAFNRATAFSPLKSSEVRGQSSNENSVNKDGKNKKEEPSVQTDQNSGLTSKDPGLSAQDSFEKQAKLNTLSDIEKIMYTAAAQNPEELEEMRAKLRNVGYCCLHEAEIRAIRKVLDVIDST